MRIIVAQIPLPGDTLPQATSGLVGLFFILLKLTIIVTAIPAAYKQRRNNVFDVDPALYKCYTNVVCLVGWQLQKTILKHRKRVK